MTGTYDPSRVTVTVGAAVLSGFAEDTFISIEEIGDGVTSVSGADGEVARAMSSDRRCRVTITLQQTSTGNDILSALLQADRISGGDGIFPITVADLTRAGMSCCARSRESVRRSGRSRSRQAG